jgi:hypothetical protein
MVVYLRRGVVVGEMSRFRAFLLGLFLGVAIGQVLGIVWFAIGRLLAMGAM